MPQGNDELPRVAVFGCGGFTGRHFENFVSRLGLQNQYVFFGHTRNAAAAARTGSFIYREGDACRDEDVRNFITDVKPAYVLNFVGTLRAPRAEDFFKINVDVSRSICEAVVATGRGSTRLLLIGSAAEYGRNAQNPVSEQAETEPIGWYGLSKLFQTLMAKYFHRTHGLPVVLARTFNVLGEGLSVDLSIGSFMKQIECVPDGGTIRVGDVSTSRDFLDIAEVCRRYWTLLLRGQAGEIYNVCSGRPRTIRSVLDDLIRRSGKRIAVEVDPVRLKAQDVASIYGDSTKFDQLAG